MKVLKILGLIGGGIIALGIAALMIIGFKSPETYVYLEREVPKRYLKKMRSLELLKEDERVKFLYSDALWDLEEGIYAATDQRLIIYAKEWNEPAFSVLYGDITEIDFQRDDSFLNDSLVHIFTLEESITFPLSSERDRDEDFVSFLREQTQILPDSSTKEFTLNPPVTESEKDHIGPKPTQKTDQ